MISSAANIPNWIMAGTTKASCCGATPTRCCRPAPASTSNHPTEIVYKRKTYFECGTEQFWLVDPGKKQIQFFHRDGRAVSVSGDEVIQGEGITQGLEINLRELFRER
ncbi:MAG: Uma2 family endonuclease [Candidatus Hydrogenedentes bacterium]|nr:Uma2 family endonuclease [Candidatus Hydrogenedentota bacterium]